MNQSFNSFEMVVAGIISHIERLEDTKGVLFLEDYPTKYLKDIVKIAEDLSQSSSEINADIISAIHNEGLEDYIHALYDFGKTQSYQTWKSILKSCTEQLAKNILAEEAENISKLALSGNEDVNKLMSRLNTLKDSAEQKLVGQQDRSIDYSDAVRTAIQSMYDRAETDDYGISTGLRDLDRQITGLSGGDLVIVGARPSMGKTAFSMGLVESAAKQNKRALIFSVEMSAPDLALRSVSSIGSIDFQHLRKGHLTELEKSNLSYAVQTLSDMPIVIDDRSGLTISMLEARAIQEDRKNKLGMIMIDYLQLMSMHDINEENASRRVGEVSRRLKLLAKQLDVPVVVLSQLNRSLESRPNRRPIKSDLRDSGSVEQDADIIIFLYRDEVYNENTQDKGIAEIIVDKQRNGPIGTVKARFIGKYTRFENIPSAD